MTFDEKIIRPFLDDAGRIAQFPAKRIKQLEVLKYLASKLEPGRVYTQDEVDAVILDWHTFGDHCLLRRDMCDARLLERDKAGTQYCVVEKDEGQGH